MNPHTRIVSPAPASPQGPMKLVDGLVTALRDWDVRYVFGVSGANIEHVHDAIHRLGDGRLESVMAKSEIGAAFMADCRARVHRTLGVCVATSGGGMMNLSVGVAEAFAESVPMLAIVGQVPSSLEGRGGFQDSSGIGRTVDAHALFSSMAKYVARIDSPETFWEKLEAAVVAAMSGRPGPAVLLLSRDIYDREVGPRPDSLPRRLEDIGGAADFDRTAARALFEELREAHRPVLLLGTGVDRCSDPAAVIDFAMRAQIPVVSTMANPGVFPNHHPLYLGMVGAAGHPSAHEYLNERADLIVAVGTGLNIMIRNAVPKAMSRAMIAAVNIDTGEICRSVDADLVVQGDAGVVFRELSAMLRKTPFTQGEVEDYALTRYVAKLAVPQPPPSRRRAWGEPAAPQPLLQSEAIEMLETTLPRDGHILFDAGNCAAAAIHSVEIPARSTSTIALGMGGMGYAIAGAIGAQIGEEAHARTTVLCGDGAFLMQGLEVHTAVELGLPILFVVFNNSKHGMCMTRQKLYFAGRVECSEYSNVDIAAVARGLGDPERLWVGSAGTRDELARALVDFGVSRRRRPGVLELRLRVEEVPPFAPFLGEHPETYVVHEISDDATVRIAAA